MRVMTGYALIALALLLPSTLAAGEVPPAVNTVAVLYFDFAGGDAELAVLRKGLAQMLIADLADTPGVAMVERDELQAVLGEQKLDRQLKMDAATSAKVGKLLGARYLVLGTAFSLSGKLAVTAKVVAVETGRIVQAHQKDGKIDDFLMIEQALGALLRDTLAHLPEPPATVKRSRPAVLRERPKAPSLLPIASMLRYAKALDLQDLGKKVQARAEMQAVVAAHPDFQLAAVDLARMMR